MYAGLLKAMYFINFLFFIEVTGVTFINKIVFQVYSSTVYHLYSVLCVYHPQPSPPITAYPS